MNEEFRWKEHFGSLCNAPLNLMSREELDAEHPAIKFDTYWNQLNDGNLPDKESFSPMHVKQVLKWMMLFERQMEGENDLYHLYLQGTSAAEITNGLLQGQFLSEFTNEECYQSRRDMMRMVLREGKPAFASANITKCNEDSEFSTNVTVGMFPFKNGKGNCCVFVIPAPVSKKIRAWINVSL